MSSSSSRGRPWETLRYQVFATETHCWICGGWVNQSLHHRDPMSRTVDHLKPRAAGGQDTRDNVRLAHRRCNQLRSMGSYTHPDLHDHAQAMQPRRDWTTPDPT